MLELRSDDEQLLLTVLNSAPIERGKQLDLLDGELATQLAQRYVGSGSSSERSHLRRMREVLHDLVREVPGAHLQLQSLLEGVELVPEVTDGGIRWLPRAPKDQMLAVRAALAWAEIAELLPGRLRACANTECNLFLLDRSRPGSAKWCSMATCGNRMKARKHAQARPAGRA
ncbi:putative RNA-binding Zn ribbon-like protein [Pseudoclavibacter sp. JAI123]|uniref:CGNR zinc finger domain-containing protein n=1 Tax=Pseudoclavibacter sp. JAI123 TaxID=2723065 RepID=UPI0015CCD014|nr:CGNR zinc finger domain-containing protein [Pseudoclavibacter sp. JAI123]NYF14839.1 putative RNA-binding Zn ribbon-like protein [Pseudoclavibacter sp. JAI123]